MTPVLQGMDFTDAAAFAKALNAARLQNRKSWITYAGRVEGRQVEIKTYDAGYLQIFRIDGQEQGAPMDMKPTAWKDLITARIGARKAA